MKMVVVVFAVVVAGFAIMIFGSLLLVKIVHRLGWPQDVLAFAGMGFVLLAGVSFAAWKLWELIYKTV